MKIKPNLPILKPMLHGVQEVEYRKPVTLKRALYDIFENEKIDFCIMSKKQEVKQFLDDLKDTKIGKRKIKRVIGAGGSSIAFETPMGDVLKISHKNPFIKNRPVQDFDAKIYERGKHQKSYYLLEEKLDKMQEQVSKIDKNLADIDYREANQRVGYVYVISNIGSFGENVYKIGMTRRLNPQERVDELGNASVPFNFDVHAMIFSKDAPALETALHHAFEDKKVNMVNKRREFFNVTLDDIEKVVKENFDGSVEFIKTATAEQYRETLKIKQEMNKQIA